MAVKKSKALLYIKVFHTLLWVFFAALLLYILYAGITDQVTALTIGAAVLAAAQGIVQTANGWRYPLTGMARNLTRDTRRGFDIFLPRALAMNDRYLFTGLFLAGMFFLVYRLVL